MNPNRIEARLTRLRAFSAQAFEAKKWQIYYQIPPLCALAEDKMTTLWEVRLSLEKG